MKIFSMHSQYDSDMDQDALANSVVYSLQVSVWTLFQPKTYYSEVQLIPSTPRGPPTKVFKMAICRLKAKRLYAYLSPIALRTFLLSNLKLFFQWNLKWLTVILRPEVGKGNLHIEGWVWKGSICFLIQ